MKEKPIEPTHFSMQRAGTQDRTIFNFYVGPKKKLEENAKIQKWKNYLVNRINKEQQEKLKKTLQDHVPGANYLTLQYGHDQTRSPNHAILEVYSGNESVPELTHAMIREALRYLKRHKGITHVSSEFTQISKHDPHPKKSIPIEDLIAQLPK